jgi:16S rRNA processing protein RimM
MGQNKSTVLVGAISGAFGIKGWLKVISFTDPPENIFDYLPWQLHNAPDGLFSREVHMLQGKLHGKGLVVQLEGLTDRDAAELLRGLEIRVRREQMPNPDGDHFYWSDLEGLQVVDTAGNSLGQVDQMLDTNSADVMVITGNVRQLIPFIYGETVLEVDLDAGLIRVDWAGVD